MKIGLYFDSRHLGEWNWEAFLAGQIGLSGTDSQILHLAHQLAKLNYDFSLFLTQSESVSGQLKHIQVDSLKTAIMNAKTNEFNILIFNSRENEETLLGIRECEKVNQPCIVWCHNGPAPFIADELFAAKFVRRVICVSATQADGLRDHPVFEKTEFIYNSINPKLFENSLKIARNPLSICYLGALTLDKGFHHLARAWPEVHSVIPDATLTVLGSAKLYNRNLLLGPLGIAEEEFEQRHIIPYLGATTNEIKNNGVTFRGLVSPDIIRSVIMASSIGVVNPNCSNSLETFCVSAVEIQAGGAVVVGANREGLKETVKNQKTGILIDSENQLSEVLIRLLRHPLMARKMGSLGMEWVAQKFNREIIMDKWKSLLISIVSNQKPNPPQFSLKRATGKVVIRECVRQVNKLPLVRNKIPTLHKLKMNLIKK